MGTNYYRYEKSYENKFKIFRDAIDLLESTNIIDNEFRDKMIFEFEEKSEIHIGKSSFGWQFTFDHNCWKYFDKDKKEILDWLKSGYIKNEYGEEISFDELMEIVESKKDGIDSQDYIKQEPNSSMGMNFHPDIYVEDLRFLHYTDFS